MHCSRCGEDNKNNDMEYFEEIQGYLCKECLKQLSFSTVGKNNEYILVNGQDLWSVDYDQGIANIREDITLDDLQVNNDEYTDLEEVGLYEYLEGNGWVIYEDETTTENKIHFFEVE